MVNYFLTVSGSKDKSRGEITIINFVYPYWLIIRYFYLNLQMHI